jgi:hypothetical protein
VANYSIFIGYRRKDVAGEAGRVYDRLVDQFTRERVFKDVESIEPGKDFRAHVLEVVNSAEVFLALIGERWREHRHRLDEPGDLVRIELEVALRNRIIQVIPVLIGDAQMPKGEEFPETIRSLRQLQAVNVRQDPDFHSDMNRLIKRLKAREQSGSVDLVPEDATAIRAAARWAAIENSMDRAAYHAFVSEFPDAAEAKVAARAIQAINKWVELDKSDTRLVEAFARRLAGQVPDTLTQVVRSHLRVLTGKAIRRDDYRRSEKSRDLQILGLPAKSNSDEWRRCYEDWKSDLNPARFPPAEYPAVAQKLRRIRLAYNRLVQFG